VDERERRIALNQTIFRAGNEILAKNGKPASAALPFICECADEGCLEAVVLSREQYEQVREHPRRFVLLRGHEARGQEPAHVVEEFDRFLILEKEDGAGRIAEDQDPRGQGEAPS
jgi:hypothetical protein